MKCSTIYAIVYRLTAIVLCTAGSSAVFAQVYKCETESGAVLYQNMPGRACKVMDLPSQNTIPAPRLPVTKPTGNTSAALPVQASSPSGFPKVDGATQKSRDSDRKRIIEDEWKKEKNKLTDLEKEFNAGQPERRSDERNFAKYEERVGKMRDEIARTKSNVESLERELKSVN
jgi:hypothetical protein